MYQLEQSKEDIGLKFIPKERQKEFIKDVLDTYKCTYHIVDKLGGDKNFHYVDPWADIGVFLGEFFLIGCCYMEFGHNLAYEDRVQELASEGLDPIQELREWYDSGDGDCHDRFVEDIMTVLNHHQYSYFDPIDNPYNDTGVVVIHNNHCVEVW